MSKFVLPIKSTYVSHWGMWECVRELIQNAKDEEEQNGHPMSVEWKSGRLTISNEGADMDRKALLIGHTSKAGSNLRGKFGEGLDLALLAGARQGREIVISTQSERWTPQIQYSREYEAQCLSIATRARKVAGTGVEVHLDVSQKEWETFRHRFLFLCSVPDNRIVRIEKRGAILLEPERKGNIYVRGIFVDHRAKLECGYDLDEMDLDRDRRMVDIWDLQWRLAQMYEEAVARRPELLSAHVYRMLRDGAEDTKLIQHHVSVEASAALTKHFHEEHGSNAFPVSSIGEARDLEHLGRKGIVVDDALRMTLTKEMGDVQRIKEDLGREVLRSIAWADLQPMERVIIEQYASAIDRLGLLKEPLLNRLDVVDFNDPNIQGLYQSSGGRISIAHRLMNDPSQVLMVLVHEVAHAVSAAGDGEHDHVATIELIWSKLYFDKHSS